MEFWPLAQMVHRQLGEDPDAPSAEVASRLRDAVTEWVDADEVEGAVRRLGLAMGLHEDDGDDTRYQVAEVRQGVLAMLAGLARGGPVVLVFEDLHQADPLLLDLIEQLVKEARRVPLLVVCVARWDFLEDRPNWAGGLPDAVTLWVEQLVARAFRCAWRWRRAVWIAPMPSVWPSTPAAIRCSSSRSPGCWSVTSGPCRRPGPAPTDRLLPATVQAVIAARIDQLSPAARELVRRASVFPRGRFDTDELSLIVEPRPELLAEAEDEELLLPDEEHRGRVAVPQRRAARRRLRLAWPSGSGERLHLRVADKLSEPRSSPTGTRGRSRSIWSRPPAPALDLHPNDRTLADRAVDALTKAGDAARRKIESRAAVDLYERALVARRAGGRVGRPRGLDRRHARRGALLAGRLRRGRDAVPQGDDAGGGRRSRRRPRGTFPGRHHPDDPGRRPSRREPVRSVARRRARGSATRSCWRARC